MAQEISSDDVLAFWFGELDSAGQASEKFMQRWWTKDPAFDQEIRDKFLTTHESIVAKKRDAWLEAPASRLAYIVVLDQFSRNMFRGTPQMFSSDRQALSAALEGIEKGDDRKVPLAQRAFYYLPLEHSEDLSVQNRGVACFERFRAERPDSQGGIIESQLDYAMKHRDIIARFRRFPHRNQILDRTSTAAEIEFLKGPGSSF